MKSYRHQDGERFERERNERAPRSVVERLPLRKGRSALMEAKNFDVNEMRRGATLGRRPSPESGRGPALLLGSLRALEHRWIP